MSQSGSAVNAVIVGRAQLGDLRALNVLLAAIQEPLFVHLCILLRDDHAAEDVLQDSLFTISRKLKSLRDPRWFRAWAYRIATREAMRQTRRSRRMPEAMDPRTLPEIASEEAEEPFDTELIEALPAVLSELSPASQLVLRMHYLDGLTHLEIAEALELSIGTIKSRLAYGLASLRKKQTGVVRSPAK